ncbi:MAG TPA: hypothetical protein VMS17_23145 [Gemmataceae bacterium]|nr:hypothetical protein [Gemmataceae bacterium]
MGTRSITVVTGRHTQDDAQKETIRLYRHWDGSPDVMLSTIADAIAVAQNVLARWQGRWRTLHPEVQSVTAKCLADALLAASLGMHGMSMRLDDKDGTPALFRGPPTAQAFGDQCDLEWVYVLDAEARTVHVYGGYGSARKLMKAGPADPTAYLEAIRDEYKAQVIEAIQSGLGAIRSAGWHVNPVPKRTKRLFLLGGDAGPRQAS